MTNPTPLDDAVIAHLWRSSIETLPRIVREPMLPPQAVFTIPGQHWADGRARVLLGTDIDLPADDLAEIVAMLATRDTQGADGEPPALAGGVS